jgi:hypothetical protein
MGALLHRILNNFQLEETEKGGRYLQYKCEIDEEKKITKRMRLGRIHLVEWNIELV